MLVTQTKQNPTTKREDRAKNCRAAVFKTGPYLQGPIPREKPHPWCEGKAERRCERRRVSTAAEKT